MIIKDVDMIDDDLDLYDDLHLDDDKILLWPYPIILTNNTMEVSIEYINKD